LSEDKEDSDNFVQSEAFMKGCGYLRHDKVNFIMTCHALSLELLKLRTVVAAIGSDIQEKRSRLLSLIVSKVEGKRKTNQ
jgi:hypothetical protein